MQKFFVYHNRKTFNVSLAEHDDLWLIAKLGEATAQEIPTHKPNHIVIIDGYEVVVTDVRIPETANLGEGDVVALVNDDGLLPYYTINDLLTPVQAPVINTTPIKAGDVVFAPTITEGGVSLNTCKVVLEDEDGDMFIKLDLAPFKYYFNSEGKAQPASPRTVFHASDRLALQNIFCMRLDYNVNRWNSLKDQYRAKQAQLKRVEAEYLASISKVSVYESGELCLAVMNLKNELIAMADQIINWWVWRCTNLYANPHQLWGVYFWSGEGSTLMISWSLSRIWIPITSWLSLAVTGAVVFVR